MTTIKDVAKQAGVSISKGGYEATRHLLDKGHRSIACISGPTKLSPSSQRLAGYHRALEEFGIPAGIGWVVEGRLTAESGFLAANRLHRRH
ncbi:substrate-binding domain-containing protein [Endozoicomonas sp. SESOKO4]|uniref:substrate-binding domain-containing protein n=1 Tax=Endozoicomonas sp. SESOKO4 TaxID=2828745 RepID=UPI0021478C83|nr:substrate-binding domain-containing protein [Endozoicomonas sp. SESOKO4]